MIFIKMHSIGTGVKTDTTLPLETPKKLEFYTKKTLKNRPKSVSERSKVQDKRTLTKKSVTKSSQSDF